MIPQISLEVRRAFSHHRHALGLRELTRRETDRLGHYSVQRPGALARGRLTTICPEHGRRVCRPSINQLLGYVLTYFSS